MMSRFLSILDQYSMDRILRSRTKQTDLQLQLERLRLLESVVVHGNDAVLITTAEPIDQPGPVIVYCNTAFTRMTGYTEQDVLGLTPRLLHSPKTDRIALDKIRSALERWVSIEIELLNCKKDGTEFWVELSIVPVANDAGWYTHWVSVQRDISDRKANEETVRRARVAEAENILLEAQVEEHRRIEADLTEAHKLARLGTWRLSADQTSMRWSEDMYAMLGLSESKHLASIDTMLSVIHEDDQQGVEQLLRAVSDHRPAEQVEFRLASNNRQIRHCRIEARPIFGAERSPGLFGFCQDITRQKETEQALLRSERLKALGQLTGGVAHDFNNLLLVTMLNIEEAILLLPTNHKILEYLDAAMLATTRSAELTSRLLAYARRTQLKPQQIDLSKTFSELSILLNRTVGDQFILTLDSGSESESVYADPSQLENALMNLVINARDAMPLGGAITITASCRDITAFTSGVEGELQPGRYIVIDVADEGIGIAPDLLARVFEPFFSTKPPSAGSGLGLSMVYGFAQQSDGHVGIVSVVGRGTTVSIYLPVGTHQTGKPTCPIRDTSWVAVGLKVLIVEDQPAVLNAVTRMMTSLGFEVISATNATTALYALANGGIVDLLFSDIVLPPPMNGVNLAIAARQLSSKIKVLLTSGYSNETLDLTKEENNTAFIAKPYGREDLRKALSSLFKNNNVIN